MLTGFPVIVLVVILFLSFHSISYASGFFPDRPKIPKPGEISGLASYLAGLEYQFNRRFNVPAMTKQLLIVALRTPPKLYRYLRMKFYFITSNSGPTIQQIRKSPASSR